jgi:alcohol dehydrogenase (cytochrome c)
VDDLRPHLRQPTLQPAEADQLPERVEAEVGLALQLGSLRSNEATPIVVGDTLYVSSSWGPKTVFAVNAKTGRIKWQYQPELPDDMIPFACCDVDTRGVAYAEGKIFVGRLDSHLVALDAQTGKQLWDTVVVDYKQGAAITSPPIVVRDIVITGYAGGDYGVRGALQGYDANTGKLLWRTWMTAGKDEPHGDRRNSAGHSTIAFWSEVYGGSRCTKTRQNIRLEPRF